MSRSMMSPVFGGGRMNWWDWDFPHRIGDQHYGMGLWPEEHSNRHNRFYVERSSPRRQQGGHSEVKNDSKCFQISVDVSHFAPNEIEVKTVDRCVVVRAKHQERADEHGFVSREFSRRYILPDEVEPETVTSSLTAQGVLLIEAPKKGAEPDKTQERVVPISMRPQQTSATDVAASKDDGGDKI